LAKVAQGWVDMLDTSSNAVMLPDQELAKKQEIIVYRMSRLRVAVAAWSTALNNKNYEDHREHWFTGLLGEVVSH
jgi:hypothetical protein